MKGMSKEDWKNGQSTRSGLLWEVERIINELPKEELPDVLLMENVPQVHAEKNEAEFDSWLEFLRGKGYQNFTRDLNAKDFGIPQNRDRCFCVSLLGEDFLDFQFPEKMELNFVMRDFLEEEVDEKYYLNSPKAKELIKKLIADGRTSPDCFGERLQRTDFNTKAVILGIIDPEGYDKENRVYSGGGCVLPC